MNLLSSFFLLKPKPLLPQGGLLSWVPESKLKRSHWIWCHGRNVSVPQSSYVRALTPSGLGKEVGLREVIRGENRW